MIVSDKNALERLNSKENLMNRLRSYDQNNSRGKAMALFTGTKSIAPPINNTPQFPHKQFNPFPTSSNSAQSEEEPEKSEEPDQSPSIDNLIKNADDQIRLQTAHDNALETLNLAVNRMKNDIDSVPVAKLPQIVAATSKVVEQIRKERNEQTKNNREGNAVHFHFYTPEQRSVKDYEIVEVG